MQEVKGPDGIELGAKYQLRARGMVLKSHAIPGDATFTGEVSGKTFWYVRTDQLTKSKREIAKEQQEELYPPKPLPKRMIRRKSTPGSPYKYKQRLCRNKGCSKVLKRDQSIVCSEKCAADLKYNCLILLSTLGVTSEDYAYFLENGV